MIENEDILNMNFYKKEKFTGSYRGMHYRIEKYSQDDTDLFRVYIWPGPYNFDTTPENQKKSTTFPFTPEGKEQVVDWMNEQWRANQSDWPEH